MKKLQIKNVKPQHENVLVEVLLEELVQNGIFNSDRTAKDDVLPIEFYKGVVKDLGPKANDVDQAPGIEIGDYVMFSQFAGVIVPTDDKYTKVIPGHMINVHTKDENMNIENLKPNAERVIVKVNKKGKVDETGIYVEDDNDPRNNITEHGTIIAVNKDITEYKVGDKPYYDPYCGDVVFENAEEKIKVLNVRDILFLDTE